MKIKPSTKEIFTDAGAFVKRLYCTIHVKWKAMKKNGDRSKICVECNKTIHDTANINDNDIVKLMKNYPQACLKVSLNQDNVIIVH